MRLIIILFKKRKFINLKKTEQENFWMGNFGDEYIKRNLGEESSEGRDYNYVNQFAKIFLNNRIEIYSSIEVGANIGINLDSLKILFPKCKTFGIEINEKAYSILKTKHNSFLGSIYEFEEDEQYELSFSRTVLIHQNEKYLKNFYEKLFNLSSKYILIDEYFSPYPVMRQYRNHDNKLFKRDFAKEFWNQFPDLKLVDYGFFWSQDSFTKSDDTNWFLFKK